MDVTALRPWLVLAHVLERIGKPHHQEARDMQFDRLIRLAPLSGVVAAVMLGVGAALASRGGYFPAADDVHEYITTNSVAIVAGTDIGGFYGTVFLVVFIGSVAEAIRGRERDNTGLASIALGGGLLGAAGLAVASSILGVAAARVDRPGGLSVEEAVALFDVQIAISAAVASVGFAVFTGATGLASLRTGVLPTWLGWASLVLGIGLLSPIHYIFQALAGLWLIAVGVSLYRRETGSAHRATRLAETVP